MNRDICREALVTAGLLREPWLAEAFDKVDREAFVPKGVWLDVQDAEGLWRFVDRDEEPDVWRQAVWNPYRSVITQLNDGATALGPGAGDFTSSVSALDIVMRKLHHLDLMPRSRVLEIGYGSGYHTALLCERVGSERVVAIEVDEELARAGASNVKAAGYDPELIVGDGLEGAPGGEPFSRIINTAALRRVPYAWIEQSRRSGVILTPFGTAYSNAGLLRLSVDATGTKAQGAFVAESSYMWIRSERPTVDLQVSGSRPAGGHRSIPRRFWRPGTSRISPSACRSRTSPTRTAGRVTTAKSSSWTRPGLRPRSSATANGGSRTRSGPGDRGICGRR